MKHPVYVCVLEGLVSYWLILQQKVPMVYPHHQVVPIMQINSLLYFISILWDILMIVTSTTEICWWLAICNKIHVTKEYSLVCYILNVFKLRLRNSGIFIYFYSHCKHNNNLFKWFCISEMYLFLLTYVQCTFSKKILVS